jgi:hypothetical protein
MTTVVRGAKSRTRLDSKTGARNVTGGIDELTYNVDIHWMREVYRRTRKNGATGVHRQMADEYAINLEVNLRSLLERAKCEN